jgi:hypothetical protein
MQVPGASVIGDRVVATIPLQHTLGSVEDRSDATVSIVKGHGENSLAFTVDPSMVGTTVWNDLSDPEVRTVADYWTNGTDDFVYLLHNGSGDGFFESVWLGDQVGPGRVDLQGFNITRIGFRLDEYTKTFDGELFVNHVSGAFLFEADHVAQTLCKNGGWKTRYRSDGTAFRNQGDCLQYFNTDT